MKQHTKNTTKIKTETNSKKQKRVLKYCGLDREGKLLKSDVQSVMWLINHFQTFVIQAGLFMGDKRCDTVPQQGHHLSVGSHTFKDFSNIFRYITSRRDKNTLRFFVHYLYSKENSVLMLWIKVRGFMAEFQCWSLNCSRHHFSRGQLYLSVLSISSPSLPYPP